ncbi:MAG: Spx/MgsR family RNA polymerase-binding regulatory protein [Myxococcota bacterium]
MKLYHYAGCSTCKKARKWLDAAGISYEAIPIVDKPPSKTHLKRLWKRSGLPLKRFFNTSGKSYREGGFGERLKTMSEDEALAALAADGKLIKRPLIDAPDHVLVGFKEVEYEEAFARISN